MKFLILATAYKKKKYSRRVQRNTTESFKCASEISTQYLSWYTARYFGSVGLVRFGHGHGHGSRTLECVV